MNDLNKILVLFAEVQSLITGIDEITETPYFRQELKRDALLFQKKLESFITRIEHDMGDEEALSFMHISKGFDEKRNEIYKELNLVVEA